MEKSNKISVIIPCYHAGETLLSIAEDLRNQTYSDFEVILVNDGDNTQDDVLREISSIDTRFRVVNKDNGGVSSARNYGLQCSRGEWIAFIDADDHVASDYLQLLIAEIDDVDIVIGGHNVINKGVECCGDIDNVGVYELKDIFRYIDSCCGLRSAWSRLYKSQIIEENHIRFDESLAIAEDWLFNLDYYRHTTRLRLIGNSGYKYVSGTKTSALSKYDKKHLSTTMECIKRTKNLYELIGAMPDEIETMERKAHAQLCFSFLKNLYCTREHPGFMEGRRLIKRDLLSNEILLKALNGSKVKKKSDILQKVIIETMNSWIIASLHKVLYEINNIKRK